MKLYKKRSVLMINSPKLVNFMQMVRGVKLERGCRSFPTEDWITLVRDMNLTLRKWNSSLGPKSVFEYDNGQVICNSRNIMELYRPPLPVPEEVKLAATVAPPVATVAPKVPEAIVSASPEAKPASLFVNDPLVPVAQQSKPIGLFTLAERIGELTSDDFAVNYPVLFRYYKDLDAMSFQDIFDRDELYDFWTDPVWKDGQIAKEHRVLWYKQPVCAETATLAIQMCTRTRMDVAGARWLCMYFNNTGCSNDAWCCDFHHICLYCGSKEHGLTNCWMARKLYGEAHKFRGSFALDPLNPSSKWGGKSLEKTLLKLVKEQEDLHHNIDETSPADHETSTDALLSWYLSETESTTEDASKSSGRADVTDLSQEEGEPAEAPRTSFELRKDAEAFPTPRSQSDFDPRPQELAQNGMPEMSITTLMISQIPEQTDAESFRRQLDSRGFIGTYNFFYMPPDVSEGWGGRCVFINFVDQAMANMCMSAFQQCPSEGVAAPYNVQGLENNIAHFSQFVGAGDVVNGPLIVPTPAPLAWALNGAQAMMNSAQGKFSPQIRGQFLKTKMCAFHQKKKCTMGVACPFAHCTEELNAPPDLSKTKLCVNFFRRKCNDMNCKFAHGHRELRATGNVYKTELCRAWASGSCKVGDTCRYAHGVKELRSGMGAEYLGSMDDHYMSDGQMGCDVMGGLQGIWEDEAAAQHYNGNGSMSSAAQGEPTYGRSDPTSGFSYGQPQDGAAEGYDDAMSDMGLSGVSTLCPGVRTFPLPREAGGSDPDEWTADDVAQWLWNLEGDKHRRYVPKFKEELIDGKSLRLLSLTDLKDLEVKELRNRKVIFEEIQKLFRP